MQLYLSFTQSYSNTLVVQLISTKLFKLSVHKKKKEKELEWRRTHYSKTNYGPLTRLTLFYYSFVIH